MTNTINSNSNKTTPMLSPITTLSQEIMRALFPSIVHGQFQKELLVFENM